MEKVQVRKQFKFLPPLGWALAIDAIDAAALPFTILPFIGEITGATVDIVQGVASIVVFEDPVMWIAGTTGEVLIPATGGLDLFPTYTAIYVARNKGLI